MCVPRPAEYLGLTVFVSTVLRDSGEAFRCFPGVGDKLLLLPGLCVPSSFGVNKTLQPLSVSPYWLLSLSVSVLTPLSVCLRTDSSLSLSPYWLLSLSVSVLTPLSLCLRTDSSLCLSPYWLLSLSVSVLTPLSLCLRTDSSLSLSLFDFVAVVVLFQCSRLVI